MRFHNHFLNSNFCWYIFAKQDHEIKRFDLRRKIKIITVHNLIINKLFCLAVKPRNAIAKKIIETTATDIFQHSKFYT